MKCIKLLEVRLFIRIGHSQGGAFLNLSMFHFLVLPVKMFMGPLIGKLTVWEGPQLLLAKVKNASARGSGSGRIGIPCGAT